MAPPTSLLTSPAKSTASTSITTAQSHARAVDNGQHATGGAGSSPLVDTDASSSFNSPSGAQPQVDQQPLPVPELPPLHFAAQTGDMSTMYQLLPDDNGKKSEQGQSTISTANANDRDGQGITALHWAAINNHVLACKLLLERGADVDARGGDLDATPLQWAARNGHLYVVHLLLKYSADPTLLDSQSFNALHLAVHSSSAFLLAYVLFTSQPVAVDSSDTEGHTGLHWACYQGDALSVELLLRSGADPRRADEAGLTSLHWAAVKGNAACIRRLIEAGADINAREKQGKTAKDMATELKSLPAYRRGLLDAGFDPDLGRRTQAGPLSARNTILVIFILPTVFMLLVLNTLAILPWWSALLLGFGELFGMHHIISRVLLDVKGSQNSDRLTKSPYLCSVIVASIIWVLYVWLTRFVPHTPGYAITNLLFGISILLCSYNFFRAITLDPGNVPQPSNDMEMKETIEELVETGSFNGMNFCLTCLTRRPLRSKHSFVTERCVARFDHYCPWVWNDVGVNNHRQFLLFVAALVVGIVLYLRLAIAFFTARAPEPSIPNACSIFTPICTAAEYDTFALAVVLWAALQLSWTIILLSAQLWQICRQMTTLEVSNVGRYGFMGGKPGAGAASSQQGAFERARSNPNATNSLAELAGGDTNGGECEHNHGHGRRGSGGGTGKASKPSFLLKILGIDRFTQGKAAEGLAKAGKVTNPFDLGMLANCQDFWTRGRELGVEYTRLYEVPEGGFRRAVRDRKRREKEGAGNGGAQGTERRDIGARNGKPGAGYERLAMRDDERMDMDEV